MSRLKLSPLQWLTHLGALAPLAVLLWDYFNNNLSVNPIQDITFRTGKPALVLLVLSLACTPLNSLFGLHWAIKLRRPLGLYAFLYVALHLLVFVGLDYGFDLGLIYDAIFDKRYALVGFAAFLLLLPLALTSTRGWQRRLGKRWTLLHRGAYAAGLLAVVHYVWLVKSDIRQPLAWGAVVVALLLVRLPAVKHLLKGTGRLLVPPALEPQPAASGPDDPADQLRRAPAGRLR